MEARVETRATVSLRPGARNKILDTSYELFARRGIRDVGVDEIISRSGVAKATFYRHFPSKDALVLAYLGRWFTARSAAIEAATQGIESADEAVLAVFGVLHDWFEHGTAEASAFLHVMIEMGPDHPLGQASIEYLMRTRQQLAELAAAAGLSDPEGFAWSCHILIKGAMVADSEGDTQAAARALAMARLLIEEHHEKKISPAPRHFTAWRDPDALNQNLASTKSTKSTKSTQSTQQRAATPQRARRAGTR